MHHGGEHQDVTRNGIPRRLNGHVVAWQQMATLFSELVDYGTNVALVLCHRLLFALTASYAFLIARKPLSFDFFLLSKSSCR